MVVYTPEERAECVKALEGSGIVPSNIDGNLAGVLRMLVTEITHLRRYGEEQVANLAVAGAANRTLLHDGFNWHQQLVSSHRVIWTLAMRTDGQIRLTERELLEVPGDPVLVSTNDPDGMLITAGPERSDGLAEG